MIDFIKEFGKAFLLGIVVFIIISLLRYSNGLEYSSIKQLLIVFAYNQLYAVVLYLANGYFFKYIFIRFKLTFFTLKTISILSIGVLGITTISVFFIRIVHEVIFGSRTLIQFVSEENPQEYYITLIISLVVSYFILAVFYYRHTQESKVNEQKIIAGTASAKFDALKNQLDPHFLFNSLNVLTSLIEENPEAATRFTTALSKVYRYVLEQKNKDLVSLEEELQFAKLYMSLIKMRFEDSIEFSIPENLSNPEAKVVPLSLQLLLENAVKHNIVTPTKKLFISITEEDGNLLVTNNLQTKKAINPSTGVGLQNIRQRYQLLTNRPVFINKDELNFTVSIPLLTKQNTVMETQDTYINELKYDRAKEYVEKLKGFYVHFVIYLLMMPIFIYLNSRSTGFPWALFPIIGWGFGIAGHAMETFNYNPLLGRNWEERKIKQFMEEDKSTNYKK
jgi:sensor histidine kinase YesM